MVIGRAYLGERKATLHDSDTTHTVHQNRLPDMLLHNQANRAYPLFFRLTGGEAVTLMAWINDQWDRSGLQGGHWRCGEPSER